MLDLQLGPGDMLKVSACGVRVYPTSAKVNVVQTYLGGKSRPVTPGRQGLITAGGDGAKPP